MLAVLAIMWRTCSRSNNTTDTRALNYEVRNSYPENATTPEGSTTPEVIDTENNEYIETQAEKRYQEKLENLNNSRTHILYSNGEMIWYNLRDNNSGYDTVYTNTLYVYNSTSDSTAAINLNKTSMENDDEMYVEDIEQIDGVITVIMIEKRNSDGWIEGTYVWKYDCISEKWTPIATACSGAKFTNNRKKVTVYYAECINPEEPSTLGKEYDYRYETFEL